MGVKNHNLARQQQAIIVYQKSHIIIYIHIIQQQSVVCMKGPNRLGICGIHVNPSIIRGGAIVKQVPYKVEDRFNQVNPYRLIWSL